MHTSVCANVGQESHGVATLAHLATIFAHIALVLLSLFVDLLSVFQHILVDFSQKVLVFLFDVNEQLLLRLKALCAFHTLKTGTTFGKLFNAVLLIPKVSSARQVLVQVALSVEGFTTD